ncbi:MAG TPA: ABC transporter permease, partial [Candidatus Sulfopaludibacter sp.]|nr:ABC transporter permease [Candidatus Sulfopaludibacter sp.]
MMRSIMQDVRYALRQFRKSPGFAGIVVAVLALGIGANIAVFTILNGVLLRPLPFAKADRVVAIDLAGTMPFYTLSYANMLQLHDAVGPQLKIGGEIYGEGSVFSVVGSGGRYQVSHASVTTGFFDMLGVSPILGRSFREDENDPGRNHVLLIGYDVWQKVFQGDPSVAGKTLMLRQQPYTVLGVLPKGFFFSFYEEMTVWSPAAIAPAGRSAMSGKDMRFGSLWARLPDGMSAAQLAANLNRIQPAIAKEATEEQVPAAISVKPYRQTIVKDASKPLLLLYAVVFGVWALACLNVTSLMLTRALSRSREQAVRAALGATSRRLVQQSVVESLLLSGVGAFAGLLLGQSAIKLLWHQIAHRLPLTWKIHVDWRVLLVLAGLTIATALIAGLVPALRAMRRDVQNDLHGITTTASAGANHTREALVVGQLALTLVFLAGAGLFLRTIYALREVPLGFSQQNVLTGGIIMNSGALTSDEVQKGQAGVVTTTYLPLLERLRAIPGVKVAALSSVLPMRREMAVSIGTDLDHKKAPAAQKPQADGRIASPGLVDALGIPMVRGRFFSDDDTPSTPPVVVINQAFANKYLPGQDPIGHTISMGKDKFDTTRIIGVIGDMKQTRVDEATKPEIYFCLAQMEPDTPLYGIATAFIQVALRARIPADLLRAQFDKALHEVAPDAATTDVETIHEAVEDSFGSQTLIAQLLETFAVLALIIASVGLYGLLSFVVAQRTREIGVRLALGASQPSIIRLVLSRALLMVGLGLALGGALAWFATTFARTYIFGVQAHDGLTFAAVILVLAASAFAATWLPARRA